MTLRSCLLPSRRSVAAPEQLEELKSRFVLSVLYYSCGRKEVSNSLSSLPGTSITIAFIIIRMYSMYYSLASLVFAYGYCNIIVQIPS